MATIKDVYGLNIQPFRKGLSPDSFCFASNDLKQATGAIENSVKEAGIGLVYGDSGTGVSYSAYLAAGKFGHDPTTVCYYPVCHICPRDFYKECCRLTGADPDGKGRQSMITAIRKKAREMKSQGRTLVLILDNAQNIPGLVMYDLKTLISEDFNMSNHMALILCGTRELKSILSQSNNRSLLQESSYCYTMKGLSEKEVVEYVRHKLRAAGADHEIVEEQVWNELYMLSSRGNCREVDNLMRTALMFGAQYSRNLIDHEILHAAATHMNILGLDN